MSSDLSVCHTQKWPELASAVFVYDRPEGPKKTKMFFFSKKKLSGLADSITKCYTYKREKNRTANTRKAGSDHPASRNPLETQPLHDVANCVYS